MTPQCACDSFVLAITDRSCPENGTPGGSHEREVCGQIGSPTDTVTIARTTLSGSLRGDDE